MSPWEPLLLLSFRTPQKVCCSCSTSSSNVHLLANPCLEVDKPLLAAVWLYFQEWHCVMTHPFCTRPPREQCPQFSSEHWSQNRTSLAHTEHHLFPQPSHMVFIVQKGLNGHLRKMLLSSHVDYVKPPGKRQFFIRLIMLKKEVWALWLKAAVWWGNIILGTARRGWALLCFVSMASVPAHCGTAAMFLPSWGAKLAECFYYQCYPHDLVKERVHVEQQEVGIPQAHRFCAAFCIECHKLYPNSV